MLCVYILGIVSTSWAIIPSSSICMRTYTYSLLFMFQEHVIWSVALLKQHIIKCIRKKMLSIPSLFWKENPATYNVGKSMHGAYRHSACLLLTTWRLSLESLSFPSVCSLSFPSHGCFSFSFIMLSKFLILEAETSNQKAERFSSPWVVPFFPPTPIATCSHSSPAARHSRLGQTEWSSKTVGLQGSTKGCFPWTVWIWGDPWNFIWQAKLEVPLLDC